MGEPILLLRLEGPLQSWGLRSRWDVRDSGHEPSKSGVVGLLGCALGISRGDPRLEELEQTLSMGVRVEHQGFSMVDYQTVTGELPTADGDSKGSPDNPSTVVSPRAYLQDAAFLVALTGPASVLEACVEALYRPVWPVYLGRRSCVPTRPILEGLFHEYESLEDALNLHHWDWAGKPMNQDTPDSLTVYLEDSTGELVRPDRLRVNPGRMYEHRYLRYKSVPFPGAAEAEQSAGTPD